MWSVESINILKMMLLKAHTIQFFLFLEQYSGNTFSWESINKRNITEEIFSFHHLHMIPESYAKATSITDISPDTHRNTVLVVCIFTLITPFLISYIHSDLLLVPSPYYSYFIFF